MKKGFLSLVLLLLACSALCQENTHMEQDPPASKSKKVQLALNDMNNYINRCEVYETDSLIYYFDNIAKLCKNKKERKEIFNFYFGFFDLHYPDTDPFLLYIYDQYDHKWIKETDVRRFQRRVDYIRRISPGAKIPELISHDIAGMPHSTNEIRNKYTILWFWDPDCDHCIEMTPILHKIYQEKHIQGDFEVFAVEVNEDYERWKPFSDKNNLWDWLNLSTSRGQANVDFIEYFDIMTTPVLFLIDNSQEHTIIARQMTLEELDRFFEK